MSFLRNTFLIGALLLAGGVHATEVTMAGGSVNFSTPDNWLGIMQTQGDPEVRVFQVPDPSPTANTALARITVTVKQAGDIASFNQYMGNATAKGMALPGYHASAKPVGPNSYVYTAKENGAQFHYTEHYWFTGGHAIQLRCVRPMRSQAGAGWIAAFDQGCDAIAKQLAH